MNILLACYFDNFLSLYFEIYLVFELADEQ